MSSFLNFCISILELISSFRILRNLTLKSSKQRQRETERDRKRQRETERDREKQRETERDRERHRET